jgi:hypothetical protein
VKTALAALRITAGVLLTTAGALTIVVGILFSITIIGALIGVPLAMAGAWVTGAGVFFFTGRNPFAGWREDLARRVRR